MNKYEYSLIIHAHATYSYGMTCTHHIFIWDDMHTLTVI